jgi:hypothetical protein
MTSTTTLVVDVVVVVVDSDAFSGFQFEWRGRCYGAMHFSRVIRPESRVT